MLLSSSASVTQIILFDKPTDWTSHDAVDYFRKKLGIKRIGHCGTLDPLATGLLIILVGSATKTQDQYMKLDKEYLATITFGQERDTYDAQGKIVKEASLLSLETFTREKVQAALASFIGEIEQTVPAHSAVKIRGKKLYQYARSGQMEKVDLPKRKVIVKELELLDFSSGDKKNPPQAQLKIACSSGTYIRSLAHDLGEMLGVFGYISSLRRTKIGSYKVEEAEKPAVGIKQRG